MKTAMKNNKAAIRGENLAQYKAFYAEFNRANPDFYALDGNECIISESLGTRLIIVSPGFFRVETPRAPTQYLHIKFSTPNGDSIYTLTPSWDGDGEKTRLSYNYGSHGEAYAAQLRLAQESYQFALSYRAPETAAATAPLRNEKKGRKNMGKLPKNVGELSDAIKNALEESADGGGAVTISWSWANETLVTAKDGAILVVCHPLEISQVWRIVKCGDKFDLTLGGDPTEYKYSSEEYALDAMAEHVWESSHTYTEAKAMMANFHRGLNKGKIQ